MDKRHRPLDRNHFGGIVPHTEVKDGSGIGQNISEVARGLDGDLVALVAEPGFTRGHVHLGQVARKSDDLDLGTVPKPDPGPVRNDQFRPSLGSGIKGVLRAERRIFHRRDPVPSLRNIPKQIAFDLIDTAHHPRRLRRFRLGLYPHGPRQEQENCQYHPFLCCL